MNTFLKSTKSQGRARRRLNRWDERGSTLVEFAFVVLLVLTFLFGIVEFSRFI
jgi:Flp pilus assembly protein TadG